MQQLLTKLVIKDLHTFVVNKFYSYVCIDPAPNGVFFAMIQLLISKVWEYVCCIVLSLCIHV